MHLSCAYVSFKNRNDAFEVFNRCKSREMSRSIIKVSKHFYPVCSFPCHWFNDINFRMWNIIPQMSYFVRKREIENSNFQNHAIFATKYMFFVSFSEKGPIECRNGLVNPLNGLFDLVGLLQFFIPDHFLYF